jgi:N-terminal double-transmembrane domain
MLTLLNTSLLPWLAAASIPLAIHLLTRRTRRRMDLPTVRVLQQTLARPSRLFKWRHLLLLLLRTLAVAALVLVFLKPTLNSPLAPKQGERMGAVLLLDVSASMSYSAGGLSSIARARVRRLAFSTRFDPATGRTWCWPARSRRPF